MFIFNVKLSRTKIFKGILAIMAIICLSIAGVGIFKIWGSNQKVETFGSLPTGGGPKHCASRATGTYKNYNKYIF